MGKLGFLVKTFFLLAYLFLIFRFVLMIFYPGTPETIVFMQVLKPVMPLLDAINACLTLPLQIVTYILHPLFPKGMEQWFPVCSAGDFMTGLAKLAFIIPGLEKSPVGAQLLSMDYAAKYPGKMEWLTFLSIPFWFALQSVLEVFTLFGREFLKNLSAFNQKRTRAVRRAPATVVDEGPVPDYLDTAPKVDRDPKVRQMLNTLKKENQALHMEKEELRSTFSQYVSPKVIKYIEHNQEWVNSMINRRMTVSVLFCDIRGFTAFSQSHSPDEVSKYLGEFFAIVNHVILAQYDGTINKLIGDSVMAYWGFPIPDTQHALVATQAAIAIYDALEKRNADPAKLPIEVGIGVCTGEVAIGNVGSKEFMDFTIVGAPVNLASRLQEANKDLHTHILIDEPTRQGLFNQISCRDLGKIQLRGVEGETHVYQPIQS